MSAPVELEQIFGGNRNPQVIGHVHLEDQLLAELGTLDHANDRIDQRQRCDAGRARRGANRRRAAARQFAFHGLVRRGHGAIQAIGGLDGACVARVPALRGQGRKRRLESVGEVGGAAARTREVSFAGIRQFIDGACEGFYLFGVRRVEARPRIAFQRFDIAPHGAKWPQAEGHLRPGGR